MLEHIKTGDEIWSDVEYSGADDTPIDKKWIPVEWLKEQIIEKRKEYPTTTSSEWIENGSVKEFVDWLLHLLEA